MFATAADARALSDGRRGKRLVPDDLSRRAFLDARRAGAGEPRQPPLPDVPHRRRRLIVVGRKPGHGRVHPQTRPPICSTSRSRSCSTWIRGENAGLAECCDIALLVRERLAADGLEAWPKTSGARGLHLYVGLARGETFDRTRTYARSVAADLVGEMPDRVTLGFTHEQRVGRVLIDWR